MADMMEYKCPACGGAMEFDSKSQKMKCPYCDTEMELSEFQEQQKETESEAKDTDSGAGEGEWTAMGTGQWQQGETDGMRVYVCESCGGEIVAEETTGATSCPFCGNRVVMKGQFEGDLRPDYIIPFKLDKKAAKEAYLKHLEKKPFLPKIFKRENHIDEIKGVYVPFWLFDVDADADISFRAEKVRTWRSGDTEYTETEHYSAQRAGTISFDHIPTDCSKKMDDNLMESIEPFDFKDAVPFEPAYMAGYIADRYDVEMEESIERAKRRVAKTAEEAMENTVTGYTSVRTSSKNVRIMNSKYWYAMYPVWILNTSWKDKNYIFAMNGQTGKMVGDLPADKGAFWRFVGITTPIVAVVVHFILKFVLMMS